MSSDTHPATRVDITSLFGEELAGRGHRIDMMLQSEAPCARSYVVAWPGGRVWVAATDTGSSLLHRLRKHLLGLRADLRLFGRLSSGDYDLLIIKDKFIAGMIGLCAAAHFKRGFLYWLSYPFPESYLERARDGTGRYPLLYRIRGLTFKILLYRLLLPRADHIFVQSEQMRRDLAAMGVEPAKMTAVPMGIRPQQFACAGNAAHSGSGPLPGHGPRIVYLGTLARIRRLDFMLSVLARVRAELPTASLTFVGGGDDESDEQFLIEQALRLGVRDAVTITGRLPRERALQYVAAADVCVSPFRPHPVLNSTSPTKLVEYMAMGKAVVANDHPEQRSLLERSGGGYCVEYDVQAFADAILRVLADPDAAREMGRRGRRYVLQHRSYASISEIAERELRRVAGNHRAGGRP